jgi:hypothetical protein
MIIRYDTDQHAFLCQGGQVLQELEGTPDDGEVYAPTQPDFYWAVDEADLDRATGGTPEHDVLVVDEGEFDVAAEGACRTASAR